MEGCTNRCLFFALQVFKLSSISTCMHFGALSQKDLNMLAKGRVGLFKVSERKNKSASSVGRIGV